MSSKPPERLQLEVRHTPTLAAQPDDVAGAADEVELPRADGRRTQKVALLRSSEGPAKKTGVEEREGVRRWSGSDER